MPLVDGSTNGISCPSRQPLTVGVYLQKQSGNTVNTGPFLDRSSAISHFHDISFSPLAPREASTTSMVLHYAILLRTRCSTRPPIMYAASQLIAAALCGDLTSLAPAPRNASCMHLSPDPAPSRMLERYPPRPGRDSKMVEISSRPAHRPMDAGRRKMT